MSVWGWKCVWWGGGCFGLLFCNNKKVVAYFTLLVQTTLLYLLPIWCIFTNSADCLASRYLGIIFHIHESQQLLGWFCLLRWFWSDAAQVLISEGQHIGNCPWMLIYLCKWKQMFSLAAILLLGIVTFFNCSKKNQLKDVSTTWFPDTKTSWCISKHK